MDQYSEKKLSRKRWEKVSCNFRTSVNLCGKTVMQNITWCLHRSCKNIKVLGPDGENSITNQTCYTFPYVMPLLCVKHINENIHRNIPKSLTQNKKKKILVYIFGSDAKKGSIDCETVEEYEIKLMVFYEILSLGNNLTVFLKYFWKNEVEVIKYHTIKEVVLVCELNNNADKFYNSSIEAMNKPIKHWLKKNEKLAYTYLPKNMKNWLNAKNLMFYIPILDQIAHSSTGMIHKS